MAIKTQYVTTDGTIFAGFEEAKEYEKNFQQANSSKKKYRVKIIVECDCVVDAFDKQDASETAEDMWYAGILKCEESICDTQVREI